VTIKDMVIKIMVTMAIQIMDITIINGSTRAAAFSQAFLAAKGKSSKHVFSSKPKIDCS